MPSAFVSYQRQAITILEVNIISTAATDIQFHIKSSLLKPLTLKVPIMTAADDIYTYFFIVFQRK